MKMKYLLTPNTSEVGNDNLYTLDIKMVKMKVMSIMSNTHELGKSLLFYRHITVTVDTER